MHHSQATKPGPALPLIGGTLMLLASTVASFAQTPEQFYKGGSIDLIVGYPAGSGNDAYARAITRHMGKYVPGNPRVLTRNMPGGGSLLAANYVYSIAPKDGTVLAIVSATGPLDELLGNANVKFQAGKFNWIGRIAPDTNPLMIWGTLPWRSWRDALTNEITLSASGAGSTLSIYPTVLNNVMRTRFKLVMGYSGSAASMLAMERGEVHGHSTTLGSIKLLHPDWIRDRKVTFMLQFALKRHPDLNDVPTVVEIAETAEQKAILGTVMGATEIGKSVLSTPGVPADRLEALRRAFDKVVKDPEFVAEFERQNVELDPMPGEQLQRFVEGFASLPPDLVAKVKAHYGG